MTRRSSRLGAFSVTVGSLAIFAIAACSSSNSGSGTTDPSTLQGFINSYCSYVGSCCGSQGQPSNGTQCRELLELSGISNYDATKGQACISAVQSASQGDAAWCVASPSPTSTACDQVTSSSSADSSTSSSGSGTTAPGANCFASSDCAPGPSGTTVSCNFPQALASGGSTCFVENHGKAGESCVGTVLTSTGTSTLTSFAPSVDAGTGVDPETLCFESDGVSCDTSTDKCVALPTIGQPCPNNDCVAGAHCDFTSFACVANIATGGACQEYSDCVSGDYCGNDKSCAVLLANGTACTNADACLSSDCVNGSCGDGSGSFGTAFGLALLCGGSGDGG